jgi:hypothetical protein
MSQFEMCILGIWGSTSQKDIVDSFEGDPEIERFLAEIGVKSAVVPKSRYTEFAEWACFEFPGEYRQVGG